MSTEPPTVSSSALRSAQPSAISAARPWRSRPLEGWHLLSLDAPTVTVVWTWFLARSFGVALPWTVLAAMALVVWTIYVLDRLFDARRAHEPLEARHRFHDRHRRAFTIGALLALAMSLPLIARLSPIELRLDGGLGALLVLWFGIIHRWFRNRAYRLPKELMVGIFFAGAVLIPTLVRLLASPPTIVLAAALLAALCTLNCLFISAWETPGRTIPTALAITLTTAAALAAIAERQHWPIFCATGLAAALLSLLSRLRLRVAPTSLRAAADLVLLTPLLLVPWLR